MKQVDQVSVWDPFVRLFHWGLAGSIATAFIVEDHYLAVHTRAGYIALTLIAARFLWGLIGPRHARFSDFVRSPAVALRYVKETLSGRAARHLGHNPAGAMMVVTLLVFVPLLALSGMVSLAITDQAGPFAGLLAGVGPRGLWLIEIHDFLADATVVLVGIHVAGVIVESFLHRENLVVSMLTGRKPRRSEDRIA